MDKETLKALIGSIKKWEKIVDGTGLDLGAKNCPLCNKFLSNECNGCPVFEKTNGCNNTPYHEYRKAKTSSINTFDKHLLMIEAAKDEVDFLKSLLPKEKDVGELTVKKENVQKLLKEKPELWKCMLLLFPELKTYYELGSVFLEKNSNSHRILIKLQEDYGDEAVLINKQGKITLGKNDSYFQERDGKYAFIDEHVHQQYAFEFTLT